jgi:hypothetical protein
MNERLTPEERVALAQAQLDERNAFLWAAGEEWREAHRWALRLRWIVAFSAGFAVDAWLRSP